MLKVAVGDLKAKGLIDKIEEGIEDSNNGREISHEEMKNEIETWFK